MAEKKTQVTFRLENSIADKLSELASQEGLSRSALAARIVRSALEKSQPSDNNNSPHGNESLVRVEQLLEQLVAGVPNTSAESKVTERAEWDREALRELADNLPHVHHEVVSRQNALEHELKLLRADLAKAVAAILAKGGKADPQRAVAWVKKHLQYEPSASPAARSREEES